MGTSFSLDLSSIMASSVLKDLGWTEDIISLTSSDFITNPQDLANFLRMLLDVDDCVDEVVSDNRIKRLFPLRTRAIAEIVSFLRLPENHISLPARKRDKAAVLLQAILAGYDSLCSTILMRTVLRADLDKKRGARSNVPFELYALTKRYGQATVEMFNKYDSGRNNVGSLFKFIRNSILYTTRTERATKSHADFGVREKQPFQDDWLSIGLAGADVIEKRDTDGMPMSIVYRFDEPLTRDVCSMLLRIALEFHAQQGNVHAPEWFERFGKSILDDPHGMNYDRKELAVGLQFCRKEFQGKFYAELPFLWGNGEAPPMFFHAPDETPLDWMSETKFYCREFVLLENLVTKGPARDMLKELMQLLEENPEAVLDKCIKMPLHAHMDFLIINRILESGQFVGLASSLKINPTSKIDAPKARSSVRSVDPRLPGQSGYANQNIKFDELPNPLEFESNFSNWARLLIHVGETTGGAKEVYKRVAKEELMSFEILSVCDLESSEHLIPREIIEKLLVENPRSNSSDKSKSDSSDKNKVRYQ